MRRSIVVYAGVALLAFGMTACCSEDKSAKKGADTPAPDPKPATTTKAASTTATAGGGAKTPAVKKPPKAPALPSGVSKVPTKAEWDAVTKEVTVKGSTALSCETKMVREWLRISCRGKNDTGGTPTTVVVTRGGRPGTVYTYSAANVTSLVARFAQGTSIDAIFSWTDKSHKLTIRWPKGQRREPGIKAVFEGAASPLDKPKGGGACKRSADCGAGKECCFSTGPGGGPFCGVGCSDQNLLVCASRSDCFSGWRCEPYEGASFSVCMPDG